ncbi:cold shock domain-containing protein [Flavihumibacter petaseus]|uniref:Putative cold shock protein n=1 Tax=Flavihumibacter petaseus NBRC 106054 TaxID=1220578 RepID=A0A0E9N1C2_9BACT|nr:cold shock domain-containing protein [Flavihumibacter petaseus]GAO43832.1 putative cold shock protein [Flavihumibacter petaseus NBRC 106054]
MATSWNKKERENKKKAERKKKEEKMQDRKENAAKGKSLDDMMAYLDENGNLTSVPPDNRPRKEIRAEDIEIGVPRQKDPSPEDLIRKGTVTYFNDGKGFGFIEDSEDKERIFVHQSEANGPLREGLKVTFEIVKGPRGFQAANVTVG